PSVCFSGPPERSDGTNSTRRKCAAFSATISGVAATLSSDDAGNPRFPGISRAGAAPLRQPGGARMRQGSRLLRRPLGLRAEDVRARGRRAGPRDRSVQTGLLPPRAGPLRRGDRDEAVARHAQEPQATQATRAVPGRPRQAVLQARHRAPGGEIPARAGIVSSGPTPALGEVYLSREELATRVRELGSQISRD